MLTIGELASLPSLKIGLASFFSADSHSGFTPKTIVLGIEISARGLLQDGRQFQFQAAAGGPPAAPKHVKITFR